MHSPFRMRVAVFTVLTSLAVVLTSTVAIAEGPGGWPQWGQNPQHTGAVDAVGQNLGGILADVIYDPFVPDEQAAADGDLLAHYQAPLLHGKDVFMEVKTGTYTPRATPDASLNWNTQIWNERRFHWQNDALVAKWTFASDWKPEPADLVGEWEPVFHAALAGGYIYVPGAGGSVFKLDPGDGSIIARISPFGEIDPNTFVAGVLSADGAGNVFYNALKLDPATLQTTNSWLVKVRPNDTTATVTYATLVPGAPTTCVRTFSTATLPWPPSPAAQPPMGNCGPQRPGINVAPAIAPDGTIYTVSRADLNSRYSYVVAVNPDLTPKWAASMRDHLSDGCNDGTTPSAMPLNGTPGGCRADAHPGVDPQTNQMPAGRVIDQSSSSPTVAPDGSVLYGAYTRYNFARGHLFKFSSTGAFQASYDFGWDITPAIYSHGGTYSVVEKDNHYDAGSYCNDPTFCPVAPQGPYYITQLTANLSVEWQFKNTNTQSCSRNLDGSLTCTTTHPNGFEWCINAPAIDANGVVYANSEDGNLYTINQGGTERQRIFLNLAIGAAYTPLAIGSDGTIYTENDGHLFVVGNSGTAVGHGGGHDGAARNGDRNTDTTD